MQSAFDFEAVDFDDLYKMLLDTSRSAFRSVRESHPNETFYGFGLHYVKAAQFIYPRFSTEESHLRRQNLSGEAQECQTLPWFHQRWNISQWPRCGMDNKQLDAISRWISDIWHRARLFRDTLIVWANIKHKIEHLCMKALKALDEEGVFGEEAVREKVVLTFRIEEDLLLWERDEYERVRLLNPSSTYLRWRIEKELCDHARVFLERDQENTWEER